MDISSFEKYKNLGFNNIPIFKKLTLDTQTALGLYLKLADNDYSYLFESVEGGEKWGRYSIIGLQCNKIIKVVQDEIFIDDNKQQTNENPLDFIHNYLAQFNTPKVPELGDFAGGLVGYFGYEAIKYIEPRIKCQNQDELQIPDILLMLSSDLIVFDNLKNTVFVITHINPNNSTYVDGINKIESILNLIDNPIPQYQNIAKDYDFVSNIGQNQYENIVAKIKEYITAGDCMQVVPSHRLSADFDNKPIELYRKLRVLNPSPYMYYLNLKDFFVAGSSPEILSKVDKDNIATVKPIAGTRPRGENESEDAELAADLLADKKEIAEHLMLIDLGRNDIGRIAKTGTVKVIKNMQIEKYSHVMHIVSTVSGEIQDNLSNIDVLKATFPAGTLSGAPKVRAMEIIEELENGKRGVYGGAVGYLGFNGTMDTAIAIRTAVIKDGKIFIQAGAGVVYDSVPIKEWEETLHKAGAIISACKQIK
jgi:anthranilate synthase component 1